MGTERLGSKTGAAPVKAGGKDARIVEDKEIAGAQEVGKFPELAVNEVAGCGGEMEKTRGGAIGQRLLGDQFFGKIVVKVGNEHRADYKEEGRPAGVSTHLQDRFSIQILDCFRHCGADTMRVPEVRPAFY